MRSQCTRSHSNVTSVTIRPAFLSVKLHAASMIVPKGCFWEAELPKDIKPVSEVVLDSQAMTIFTDVFIAFDSE